MGIKRLREDAATNHNPTRKQPTMALKQGTYTMTSDGTKFFDEAGQLEALDHEARLDQIAQIERFISRQIWERGQETRARNIIADFVEFQRRDAEGVLDQVAGIVVGATHWERLAPAQPGPEDAQAELDTGSGEDQDGTADLAGIDETADLAQAMREGVA